MSSPEPARTGDFVLSVEDDEGIYCLIRSAFKDLNASLQLKRVTDGEDALNFLKRLGPFRDAPRPSLILLNSNLPKLSGPEVLVQVKADESLRGIPVVMFSSSHVDEERAKCLALGAREYLTKPTTYDEFVHAIRSVCSFAAAT